MIFVSSVWNVRKEDARKKIVVIHTSKFSFFSKNTNKNKSPPMILMYQTSKILSWKNYKTV